MASMSVPYDTPPLPSVIMRGLYLGVIGIVAGSTLIGFRIDGSIESIGHPALILLLAAILVVGLHLAPPPSS